MSKVRVKATVMAITTVSRVGRRRAWRKRMAVAVALASLKLHKIVFSQLFMQSRYVISDRLINGFHL